MAQIESQRQGTSGPMPPADRSQPTAQPVLVWGDRDRLQQLFDPALASYRLIAIDSPLELAHRWQAEPGWVLIDLAAASNPASNSASNSASNREDYSPLDLLVALGQICPSRPLPVILLVAPGQERDALEAMKLGAADYLFTADLRSEVLGAKLSLPPGQVPPTPETEPRREPYRDLVEHSPDIVERFDCDLRHLYVSPVLADLTGLHTEVFLGKTCRELGMDETMVNAWEAAAATALATGENQAIEFSTPTRLGVRHFEMAIAPERDRTGTITSILCVSRDITHRITAQQSHQQRLTAAQAAAQAATVAHDGLTSVFDRINDGIIAFDRDAHCVYLNRSAETILRRSLVDLKGQLVWTAFPEAVDTPIYEVYNRVFDQQQPESLD